MAQEEKYGVRDLTYSAWHRRESTARFIGIEHAQLLSMIDIDVQVWVEFDRGTKMPLALIETAEDIGQAYKCASVTKNLALMAGIPSLLVLYRKSIEDNPSQQKYRDIASFRVKRLTPVPELEWRTLSPTKYAELLLAMRGWAAERIDRDLFSDNDDK